MNATRLSLIAAALATAAFGAMADEADGSQYAAQFNSTRTRAEVQADLAQAKQGPNVWSIQYNPLATFKSDKSREAVRADFLANRDAVAAMTSEDSGATYIAQHNVLTPTSTRLAGQPVNDAK